MKIDISKQERIIIGLLILIVALFIIFFVTAVKRTAKIDSQYKVDMAIRDSVIVEKRRVIEALQNSNYDKQQAIEDMKIRDSILYLDVIRRIDKLKLYDKQDEDITKRLHSSGFNADSIRRAFSRF